MFIYNLTLRDIPWCKISVQTFLISNSKMIFGHQVQKLTLIISNNQPDRFSFCLTFESKYPYDIEWVFYCLIFLQTCCNPTGWYAIKIKEQYSKINGPWRIVLKILSKQTHTQHSDVIVETEKNAAGWRAAKNWAFHGLSYWNKSSSLGEKPKS